MTLRYKIDKWLLEKREQEWHVFAADLIGED